MLPFAVVRCWAARREEGNERMTYSGMATLRWAVPCIVAGGFFYALYGVLNRILAATLMGYFLGNFVGAALLAVGVAGLNGYLFERGVRLGRVGQGGLYACMVAYAVWAALGLASVVSLALVGRTRFHFIAIDFIDGLLVVLFVGSVLFGAALYSQTNVVPWGVALLLTIASVLALVPGLAGFVLGMPVWVFEVLRVLYGAAWAWVGYGLWAARGTTVQHQPRAIRNRRSGSGRV